MIHRLARDPTSGSLNAATLLALAAMPIPQFFALFGEHEGAPEYMDAAAQLDWMNRLRAKHGKPPLVSRRIGRKVQHG